MINHTLVSRSLFAFLAVPLLASAGCELDLIAEHLPIAQEDFFPTRHVAAISDNHEHVFVASSTSGALKLVSSNGNPTDEWTLSSPWLTRAAATYYGPDFQASGFDQHNEAALVLHENGSILPWFHHGGQLGFHWAGRIVVPASPANVVGVSYLDVDQSHDGVVFVLTHEVLQAGGGQARIWRRALDGSWTSVTGLDKPATLAYDQHVNDVTVAYTRTSNRDITLEEYDEDLSFNRTRTLPDLRQVDDFEVLGGWFYMGVLTCDNAPCTDSTREFQIRDSNLDLDDAVGVATEGVALDLPPFPLDIDSNVDVWRVGRADMQLSEYDVVVP